MTDNKSEQELNELFKGDSNINSLKRTVKKAKRIALLRNIIVSLFVVVFLSTLLGFTWLSIMRWSQENAMRDVELFSRITQPNIERLGAQNKENGLYEGLLIFNRHKEINGIPIDWSDQIVTYSLFGGVGRLTGNHSPLQLVDEEDGQVRFYDRDTKQRIMQFYHPEVTYNHIRNDLNKLNDFSNETLVEIALSFDQKYSAEEVRDFIPKGVDLKWYWADTYTNLDRLKGADIKNADGKTEKIPPSPELAIDIYGFGGSQRKPSMSEERFIRDIQTGLNFEKGKYYDEFERIYKYLKGDSSTLTTDHIKVLGVVVTGTAEGLAKLEGLDVVRASVLGVSMDPNK